MVLRNIAHQLIEISRTGYYEKAQRDLFTNTARIFELNPLVNGERLQNIAPRSKLWRDNIPRMGLVWVSQPLIAKLSCVYHNF